MASSCAVSFGSVIRTWTSTRRSRLRCIMSALPNQCSSDPTKWNTLECSRNRPRIDRTRTFSDSPATPGFSAQMPRTTMSTGTPACAARYSASITCSSTRLFTLMRIPVGPPLPQVLDLPLDQLHDAGPDAVRRHEDAAVPVLFARSRSAR